MESGLRVRAEKHSNEESFSLFDKKNRCSFNCTNLLGTGGFGFVNGVDVKLAVVDVDDGVVAVVGGMVVIAHLRSKPACTADLHATATSPAKRMKR